MSAWKSRWSWVRLVKTATAKWIASARCRTSACEETSIAQAPSPPSSIRRKVALQVDRLGRGPLDLLDHAADDLLHRAEQPASRAGRLEDLADQEGRRRLAVGAGDPDHVSSAVGSPRSGPRSAPSRPARPPPATWGTSGRARARQPGRRRRPRPRRARSRGRRLLAGEAEEEGPVAHLRGCRRPGRRSPPAVAAISPGARRASSSSELHPGRF